ncbi:MAG: TolC family protein, partial [Planctomycetes bacterium]|nr:TolC family protein [Planctomycetota bacterium]
HRVPSSGPIAARDSSPPPVAPAAALYEEPLAESGADGTPAASPLQLIEVLQMALESSPDLDAASEQTWVSEAGLRRARAEFYPTLSFAESYGVTDNPVQVFSYQLNQAILSFNQDFNNPRTTDNFDTRLRVQYGLYTGGRRLAEMRAAQWQLQADHAALESTRNELIFRAAQAYYRLLQANELVRVRQETVEQVQRHLEFVQARFRAETAVKSDVLSVEVRLAEAREQLGTAQHQVELAWAVLENVLGRRLRRRPLPPAVPKAPWSDHVDELEQAVAAALDGRPEVNQISSRYQAAQYAVEAAEAGKRPTLSFVGDYNVFTGDFQRGNDSFFVGLVLELNLLDAGRTRAEVDRAAAQARVLAAKYRRLAADIELDVRRAYLQLRDAEQRLAVAKQAVEYATESLREIEVRYRGQTATITELIDAQVRLSDARVRHANAQADVEIARASLERAVGRLAEIVAN